MTTENLTPSENLEATPALSPTICSESLFRFQDNDPYKIAGWFTSQSVGFTIADMSVLDRHPDILRDFEAALGVAVASLSSALLAREQVTGAPENSPGGEAQPLSQ
jgi:hypothetical protein